MAGSIVETLTKDPRTGIRKLDLAWTSHSSNGTVSGTDTTLFDGGEILRVVTVPGTSTPQPDDNYDITLLDPDGADVLLGRGANRDEANTEQIVPIMDDGQGTPQYFGRVFAIGPLELNIATAGNSKEGQVIIYWR